MSITLSWQGSGALRVEARADSEGITCQVLQKIFDAMESDIETLQEVLEKLQDEADEQDDEGDKVDAQHDHHTLNFVRTNFHFCDRKNFNYVVFDILNGKFDD